jgi:HSP20 family molecular chaperone IbpA
MNCIKIRHTFRDASAYPAGLKPFGDPGRSSPLNSRDLTDCCRLWPVLSETGEEYVLKMDVPGLERDDLGVRYESGRLTVFMRTPAFEPRGQNYHMEKDRGEFTRTFTLPDKIAVQNIRAEVQGGVLTIHIPKREDPPAHEVEVG